MTTIHVTAADIRAGIAGDCNDCPVALAICRATDGHSDSSVSEKDFVLRVEIDGRSVVAPREVRSFVHAFDAMPRTPAGRVKRQHLPAPFTFELPAWDDPEWQEECGDCQRLCDADELNEEGYCRECTSMEGQP